MPLKESLRALVGLNAASVIRGLRLGPGELAVSSRRSYLAARPLESRELRSIPEVELIEILGTRKPKIRLTVQPDQDGMLPFDEAVALISILSLIHI